MSPPRVSLTYGSFLDRCICNLNALQLHFNQAPSKTTSFTDFDVGYMAHNHNKWTVCDYAMKIMQGSL